LRDLQQAERGSNPRDAALFGLARVGMFVQEGAAHLRALGRFSGPAPDEVLRRLARAIAGLNEGTIDPILAPALDRRSTVDAQTGKSRGLRPGLAPHDLAGRATVAAAAEILQLAGYARKVAAQEVAKALRGHPLLSDIKDEPWHAVSRWRDEIKARARRRAERRELPDMLGQPADYRTQAVGQFNYLVGEARRLKQDGAPPEVLVKIARDQLDHGLGMGEGPKF
jgi:hypothetical protein